MIGGLMWMIFSSETGSEAWTGGGGARGSGSGRSRGRNGFRLPGRSRANARYGRKDGARLFFAFDGRGADAGRPLLRFYEGYGLLDHSLLRHGRGLSRGGFLRRDGGR